MTTQSLSFEASPRELVGKGVKELRRAGIIPIHVYGSGLDYLNLQADAASVRSIVAEAGTNIPVTVSVKALEATLFSFIREVQRHPLTEAILHVDFLQVPLTQTMTADVPITIIGESPAMRYMGGVLNQALQSLQVESLPLDVPMSAEVDISVLKDFDSSIYVSDIDLGPKVTVLSGPDEMIARVNAPRVAVEEGVVAGEVGDEDVGGVVETESGAEEPTSEA